MKITFPYHLLSKDEYPELYAIVEKQKTNFDLTNIKTYIWLWHWPWGANAAATSFLGDKMIITREILQIMSSDEMEGIIAHEFSHLYNRDILKCQTVRLLYFSPGLIAFFLFYVARFYNILNNFGIQIVISLLLLVSIPSWIIGVKVENWLSVESETRADRDAVIKTQNSEAFMRGLIKIYNYRNRDTKRPSKLSVISSTIDYVISYFTGFTHPGIKTRVENIEFTKKLIEVPKGSIAPPIITPK